MSSDVFRVESIVELRALQRVFREAKFCTVADDEEISTSPIVAAMFDRVMDALIESCVQLEGESARARWLNWLNMTSPERDEWSAASSRARKNELWPTWTDREQVEYVALLFRPFKLDDSSLKQFISEVTESFMNRKA